MVCVKVQQPQRLSTHFAKYKIIWCNNWVYGGKQLTLFVLIIQCKKVKVYLRRDCLKHPSNLNRVTLSIKENCKKIDKIDEQTVIHNVNDAMINRRIFYLIVTSLEFHKDNFDATNIAFNFLVFCFQLGNYRLMIHFSIWMCHYSSFLTYKNMTFVDSIIPPPLKTKYKWITWSLCICTHTFLRCSVCIMCWFRKNFKHLGRYWKKLTLVL